jgi:hypothetical protein
MLLADPATGVVDYNLVEQARNEVMARSKQNQKAALGLNWTQMGPDNVGGRCRAILVDQSNPNTLYAGSVTGGLFVSTDGTQTWTQVGGHNGILGENLAVSCITQTANGRIFFGTGSSFEGSFSGGGGSTAIGNGVYEYEPSTGNILPVVTNATAVPNNSAGSFWSYTNAIASKGNRLYLGTKDGMVWADPDGNGDYPTTFAGWTNPIEIVAGLLEKGTCHDIDIASDGSMVVCFPNKVYTSNSDAFGSFTGRGVTGSRLAAAIAPSDPNVIYLVTTTGGGELRNLEITRDKGANWDVIVPGGSPANDPLGRGQGGDGQGNYDLAIAVDPSDWGHMLLGGIRMFEWQYNPGSNPIGGSWLMATNEFESIFNPFYIHADKHTIVWHDANTIYVGSDGGINRTITGGQSWQERNLGFNVTTFYDVATASNGWFVGGSQDNGNQMYTYNSFGEITPLGSTEIQNTDPNITFGDGFDVAFSNIAGLVFATAQYSAVIRASGAGGGSFYDTDMLTKYQNGGQAFHTVIKMWENQNDPLTLDSIKVSIDSSGTIIAPGDTVYPGDTIFAGDTVNYTSLTNGLGLTYVMPANHVVAAPKDSLILADPIQSKFVLRMGDGVYYTKDAARVNAIDPKWYKVYATGNAENFEWSNDGNHLFIGTASGSVVRISGFQQYTDSFDLDLRLGPIQLTQQTIATGLGGVVSIAIDPSDNNNMIATAASYNTSDHVYRCTNALTASTTSGNFVDIQGVGGTALPQMPVFDAVIDYNDNDKVIIGTEWGVWSTDNAFSSAASGVDWTDESGTGMTHVPVHALVQQDLRSVHAVNSGCIYLGTHGRGFYMACDLFTSVNENEFDEFEDDDFITNLSVYPNPINNQGSLAFELKEPANTVVKIYSLAGKLVKTINLGMKPSGAHTEQINVAELSVGSYIVSLETETERSVAKFMVTR